MNAFWENLSENALEQIDPIEYKGSKNIIKKAQIKRPHRLGLRIMIAAAAMLIIGVVCYAAVERWWLQPPRIIDDMPPVIEVPDDGNVGEQDGGVDFDYTNLASDILTKLGIDTTGLTPKITTQFATRYERAQVKVAFNDFYIIFDAADKTPISGQLPKHADTDQPISEQQALTAAQQFYDTLPFPDGYIYSNSNRIDSQYGQFSFTRSYQIPLGDSAVSVVNPYEEIRITVDYLSGEVESWNSFYFPLLDDHTPQDTPISEADAINIAAQKLEDAKGYTASAEISIVLPNYLFTDYSDQISQGQNYVYPSDTRIAWLVEFDRSNELFTDKIKIYVDYYTGEILGGDQVK